MIFIDKQGKTFEISFTVQENGDGYFIINHNGVRFAGALISMLQKKCSVLNDLHSELPQHCLELWDKYKAFL